RSPILLSIALIHITEQMIVLTSHDQTFVEQIADDVCVLEDLELKLRIYCLRSRNYSASYSFLFSLTEIEVILIKSVQSYQTESVELSLAVTVIEKTVKNMLNMERLLYMDKKHIFVTLEE